MEWLGISADIASLLGAMFALLAWLQARQVRKAIVLQYGTDRLVLPVELRRAEFTRAEVLGRIGMLPMKTPGARFSLGYVNNLEFFRQISTIISGSDDATLIIPCKKEEFEQFAL